MPSFDIAIAGELNLDLILYGLPDELAPERELLARDMILTLGSSSAIVAHNLAQLGSRVAFLSCIATDQLGTVALERLAQGGVDVSHVRRLPGAVKTGLTVILPRTGWRNILTYPGTIFDLRPEHLDIDYLASARHFHLSSFFLHRGLREHIPELFRKLKAKGLTISLDPNDDPDDQWQGLDEVLPLVDVLLPNKRELLRIARTNDFEAAVARLSQQIPLLVVKLGEHGAMARRGNEQVNSPALQVDVVDPVGAGDSFDAGFLHEFVAGKDLAACLAAGNLAGAFSTTRAGGTEAFRDPDYRRQFYDTHHLAIAKD
jgi:sugar/nucleoside kinase (ribokinase family)